MKHNIYKRHRHYSLFVLAHIFDKDYNFSWKFLILIARKYIICSSQQKQPASDNMNMKTLLIAFFMSAVETLLAWSLRMWSVFQMLRTHTQTPMTAAFYYATISREI